MLRDDYPWFLDSCSTTQNIHFLAHPENKSKNRKENTSWLCCIRSGMDSGASNGRSQSNRLIVMYRLVSANAYEPLNSAYKRLKRISNGNTRIFPIDTWKTPAWHPGYISMSRLDHFQPTFVSPSRILLIRCWVLVRRKIPSPAGISPFYWLDRLGPCISFPGLGRLLRAFGWHLEHLRQQTGFTWW